jgi:hypothetical protein
VSAFNFVTGADASGAHNAPIVVDTIKLMRNVDISLWICVIPANVVDAKLYGYRLQFTIPVGDTDGADMISFCEQQFDYHFSVIVESFGIR